MRFLGKLKPPSGVFDPKSLNPALWLRADREVYTDGARTFSAAAAHWLTAADSASLKMGDIDFTIGCWVKFNSVAADNIVIAKQNAAGSDNEYMLWNATSDKKFRFTVKNTANSTSSTTIHTTVCTTGVWYFVYCYHDSTNDILGIGVQGVEVQTTSWTGGVRSSANAFRFGSRSDETVGKLDADVDSGFLIKRLLTTAEKTDLYNGGNGRSFNSAISTVTADSSLSWWDFEGAYGTVTDKKGSNNLTASNTAIISPSPATLNGGFETAGGGGADTLGSWTEGTAGASTVTQDAVTFRSGAKCCKFTVDGSNSLANITQTVLTVGRAYTYSLWARSTSGAPTLSVVDGTSSLQASHTLSTTYTNFSNTWIAGGTVFEIKRLGMTSLGCYIDDVTLTDLGPTFVPGVASSVAANNDYVARWNDQSGNGRHFTQTTASKRPTYSTSAINSRAGLTFDGVDDYMSIASTTLSGAFTAFMVFKCTGTAGQIINHGGDTASIDGFAFVTSGSPNTAIRRTLQTDRAHTANWGVDNVTKIATFSHNGTHATHLVRINGTDTAGATYGGFGNDVGVASATSALYLMSKSTTLSFSNGLMCELLIFERQLSTFDMTRVERYLGARFGVTVA